MLNILALAASMSDINPVATTWTFTYSISDQEDPSAELALPKELLEDNCIQFILWQLEEWRKSTPTYNFIRGIIRCTKGRSLRQLQVYMPEAKLKPLRGVFLHTKVPEVLKESVRVGTLYTAGDYRPIKKRGSQYCNKSCKCCHLNKRARSSSPEV